MNKRQCPGVAAVFIQVTCTKPGGIVCLFILFISPHPESGAQLHKKKGRKGSPYSTVERRVPKLTLLLFSQPAGDVSHKPGGRLPFLSGRKGKKGEEGGACCGVKGSVS